PGWIRPLRSSLPFLGGGSAATCNSVFDDLPPPFPKEAGHVVPFHQPGPQPPPDFPLRRDALDHAPPHPAGRRPGRTGRAAVPAECPGGGQDVEDPAVEPLRPQLRYLVRWLCQGL